METLYQDLWNKVQVQCYRQQTTAVQVADDSWYQRRPDVLAFLSSG